MRRISGFIPRRDGSADQFYTSCALALLTRPGTMVQILLENADGEQKLVTRYLYDEVS